MSQYADTIDLATLELRAGEGRRFEARVRVDPIEIGDQSYAVGDGSVEVRLEVSRTVSGWALRLRFEATLHGTCMRCLGDAEPSFEIDAREVDQPGGGEDLRSPYLQADRLDLAAWTRDSLVLALPAQVVCSEDCLGLCPVCGVNLNEVEPGTHSHEQAPDPRWAKLAEWKPE